MIGGRWTQPQHEREITWGERKTLQALATLLAQRPYPPTIRDIAAQRKVTVNAARERLDGLEAKGFIARYPGKVRAIWLTEKGKAECEAMAEP